MKIRKLVNGQPINEPIHEEVLAAITAAVKMAMASGSGYNLKVRSFRRSANNTPTWSMVSRKDQIDSRRII